MNHSNLTLPAHYDELNATEAQWIDGGGIWDIFRALASIFDSFHLSGSVGTSQTNTQNAAYVQSGNKVATSGSTSTSATVDNQLNWSFNASQFINGLFSLFRQF